MKKRLTAIILILMIALMVMPAPAFASQTPLDEKTIYYTPASDYKSGDCILTATKMMIRRMSIIYDRGDWTKITNEALRGQATIAGLLLNSFKADVEGLVYRVESGTFSGKGDAARIKEIEDILRTHPEGIVVHGINAASSGTHGLLVVAVVNGVPYAADPSRNTGLSNKGIQAWADTTMLNVSLVSKYWYISEVSASTKTTPGKSPSEAALSNLRIKSVKAPEAIKKGKKYTIKGTVKSNKKITKVTVKILDGNGNTVCSASRKPNAKSFNIKKLSGKMKFSKLKRGSYTYQVIAKDSTQKLKLVNKPFTVY